MTKSKFSKPPALSKEEQHFVDGANKSEKKDKLSSIFLRCNQLLIDDLKRISSIEDMSLNKLCLRVLRNFTIQYEKKNEEKNKEDSIRIANDYLK